MALLRVLLRFGAFLACGSAGSVCLPRFAERAVVLGVSSVDGCGSSFVFPVSSVTCGAPEAA